MKWTLRLIVKIKITKLGLVTFYKTRATRPLQDQDQNYKTKTEVQAYRAKFATLVGRAQDAIKGGASKDQLASMVKTDDLSWQFNAGFWSSLYDELTKK